MLSLYNGTVFQIKGIVFRLVEHFGIGDQAKT